MKIFMTGATGYIGQQLALRLAAEGHQVIALVRNVEKAAFLLDHPHVQLIRGDIMEPGTLLHAMKGCQAVYHLAALASVWNKEPDAFHRLNVTGLQHVLDCCLVLGIEKVVFTSTAGVAGHSIDGNPVKEYTNPSPRLETAYEQSKVAAENLLLTYCSKGIYGILVNPSRVYGPGLLTESNGVTRLVKMYTEGKWHILPGNGESIGNYVFIDDVVNGHLLAMEKARPGQRYLLGGENSSFTDFFKRIDTHTGRRHWLFKFPLSLMLTLSHLGLFIAERTGRQPLITPSFVRKYTKHWVLDSGKAISELGYTYTPLSEGLRKTMEWILTLS